MTEVACARTSFRENYCVWEFLVGLGMAGIAIVVSILGKPTPGEPASCKVSHCSKAELDRRTKFMFVVTRVPFGGGMCPRHPTTAHRKFHCHRATQCRRLPRKNPS